MVASSIHCVSRAESRLPFEIDDASRPEPDFEVEAGGGIERQALDWRPKDDLRP